MTGLEGMAESVSFETLRGCRAKQMFGLVLCISSAMNNQLNNDDARPFLISHFLDLDCLHSKGHVNPAKQTTLNMK
jgi:hypothetical protein